MALGFIGRHLKGDDPTTQDRISRLASWERFVPKQVAPAQHRWHLLEWAERQVGRSLTLLRPFYIRREAYEGWHATANG